MTRDLTIAVWVYRIKPDHADDVAASDIETIVAKVPVSETKGDFFFFIWKDRLRLYGGSKAYARSHILSMPYETWLHIAVTRAGNAVKFYVNGEFLGEDYLAEDFPTSDNPLIIGSSPGAGFHFNGKIDELRMYNRSLHQEEVRLVAGARNLVTLPY